MQAPDGAIYYFNFETEESTWEHPTDVRYKELYEARKTPSWPRSWANISLF